MLKYKLFLYSLIVVLISSCSSKGGKVDSFMDFSPINGEEMSKEEFDKKILTEEAQEKSTKSKSSKDKNQDSSKSNKKADIEIINILKKLNIEYLNVDVADLVYEVKPIKESHDHITYQFKVYSRTEGMVDYFTNWQNYAIAKFDVYENKVKPGTYKSKTRLRKKVREINLSYADNHKTMLVDKVTPPDNRTRPSVQNKFKRYSYDPLSAAFEARRRIKEAFDDSNFNSKGIYSFTIPVYDGRRRTDINFEVRKKKTKKGLYPLTITRKAIAGYKDKELANIKKGRALIKLNLSPVDFFPITGNGQHPLGTATAEFEKDCKKGFMHCIKF